MVHGQFRRRNLAAAVMTNPQRPLPLPPLTGAEFPGLAPFPANLLFRHFDEKRGSLHLSSQPLFVQALQLFEIHREPSGHQKIQTASQSGPAVAANVTLQLPESEIDEKNHGGPDEDFMSRKQLHTILVKHKNTSLRKKAAGRLQS